MWDSMRIISTVAGALLAGVCTWIVFAVLGADPVIAVIALLAGGAAGAWYGQRLVRRARSEATMPGKRSRH